MPSNTLHLHRLQLCIAACRGDAPTCLDLLRAGTDPNVKWSSCITMEQEYDLSAAAFSAPSSGGQNGFWHSTASAFKTRPLWMAARFGHANCCAVLSRYGALVNAVDSSQDEFGTSALYEAATHFYPEAVHTLLEAGADPNNISNESTGTILQDVLIRQTSCPNDAELKLRTCRALLQGGANPNRISPGNPSFPISIASCNQECSLVQMLLQFGARTQPAHHWMSRLLSRFL